MLTESGETTSEASVSDINAVELTIPNGPIPVERHRRSAIAEHRRAPPRSAYQRAFVREFTRVYTWS
jgi:hypothetical protein